MLANMLRMKASTSAPPIILYDNGTGGFDWTGNDLEITTDHLEVRKSVDAEVNDGSGSVTIRCTKSVDFTKYKTLTIDVMWLNNVGDFNSFNAKLYSKGTQVLIKDLATVVSNQRYIIETDISGFTGTDSLVLDSLWTFVSSGMGNCNYNIYKVMLT